MATATIQLDADSRAFLRREAVGLGETYGVDNEKYFRDLERRTILERIDQMHRAIALLDALGWDETADGEGSIDVDRDDFREWLFGLRHEYEQMIGEHMVSRRRAEQGDEGMYFDDGQEDAIRRHQEYIDRDLMGADVIEATLRQLAVA